MFSLRRAEIGDVRDIRAIDRSSFPSPWSEGWTIAQVTDPGRVHLVAERDSTIVGHGGLMFLGDQAHVATIAVSEDFRRQGIGMAIMNRLRKAATEGGYYELTLEVRQSNLPAIALYERHGLAVMGRRPGYYADNGEDAYIMTARLLTKLGSDPTEVA